MDLKRLTKSLVLLDKEKGPILAVIPGDSKLSFNKLKEVTNSKRVRLVPFEEAEEYSGYPPGATPMIFHKVLMKVVLDKKLTSFDSIFGGGGIRTKILELKTEDVIKLNNALVGDIIE